LTILLAFVGHRHCVVQEPAVGSCRNQSFSNGLMRQVQSTSGVMEFVRYSLIIYWP
jgi:hypothetical protein